MAEQDGEFERLMAETERLLGAAGGSSGKGGPAPRRTGSVVRRPTGKLEISLWTSALSGGIAAALVAVVFAATPFLGAVSGAAGAFVATFVIMLVQRITGGRKR